MTKETLRLLPLPWDLEDEILSRVPAPSLSRLRFSCKRWNALFKDQKFMKKHSDKAAKQHMVLMLSNLKVYSMNVNFHEIHGNVVDPHKLMSLKFSIIRKKPRYVKYFTVTGVWNPCTGQIRWIPFSNRYNTISEFVLGYDNTAGILVTHSVELLSMESMILGLIRGSILITLLPNTAT